MFELRKRFILRLSYQTSIMLMSLYQTRDWNMNMCVHIAEEEEVEEAVIDGYGIYQIYIYFSLGHMHFFQSFFWTGRWSMMLYLSVTRRAGNLTNLLISHNWFHITHQQQFRFRLSELQLQLQMSSKRGQWKRNLPSEISFLVAFVSFRWRWSVKVICRH